MCTRSSTGVAVHILLQSASQTRKVKAESRKAQLAN
jgi:hypothetical protein